ncbi:tetratricopeptide repeat protein [Flavobacterium aciduliphilum]|uniref:Tetratricopeptide repeat protein n=1 Tax=Flavobacterium aciduliphilum TaxID=1101402 RepID=A0A328YPP7_9FLAO|nr:tetratricopeptide repeat protein [Flavobacterium aciduliphilum]RAR75570.1 tetratricopeptide repeat protein [Flavobacterium aciduliphilum]
MATFNKRGYKAPKPKEEKVENTFIEETPEIDTKDSTTAKAFDALDETASKTEEWVARNQKYIIGVIAAAAFVTLGYLSFQKFIVEPKEEDATTDLFVTQNNFQLATDATDAKKQDSLYTLVLKGAEGKQGAPGIAEQFSGTDSGNIANYYAGIASLNLKKYDDAISYLEKFSSKDAFLGSIAIGAIGDAYAQKNDAKKALEMYEKAAHQTTNEFTTPRYLFKAGQTALLLGNKAEALKYFTEIKEKYDATPEAQNIDALIGMAQ